MRAVKTAHSIRECSKRATLKVMKSPRRRWHFGFRKTEQKKTAENRCHKPNSTQRLRLAGGIALAQNQTSVYEEGRSFFIIHRSAKRDAQQSWQKIV